MALQLVDWPSAMTFQQSLIRFSSAYALGYVSNVSPKLSKLAVAQIRGKQDKSVAFSKAYQILIAALGPNRFPAFCGIVIGGSTSFQIPIYRWLAQLNSIAQSQNRRLSIVTIARLARFVAAFIASWLGIHLLNSSRSLSASRQNVASNEMHCSSTNIKNVEKSNNQPRSLVPEDGKTIDLTLFAITRAADVIVGEIWSRFRSKKMTRKRERLLDFIGSSIDAGIFALSSGTIMWTWFYQPHRLPKSYNQWISEAAQIDPRLISALREARYGSFTYGRDTGHAALLQSMCKDYGWPLEWGDPAKSIPIPCEMVHMGTGPSCEKHSLVRFGRAFKFALATYLPLNLLVRARSTPSLRTLRRALRDAVRSSTFLGAFVAIFYYSVCLARTRLGPKVFSHNTISPLAWDSGLCVRAGCILCGWSILIEAQRRRQEIAFFVAPRALGTLFPRRYDRKYQWRETLAFALSTAVVFTCVQEKPERVRGVLGNLLKKLLSSQPRRMVTPH
ncbi:integral membrane protein [Xylona heveae TC161]|uniref:Integral membrane protein n=1 Tax=Xylona heveae (strain CBS 132557 / TC161) TaxID=1328760 RepID=A0A165A657_XYLHT|nr:integral membrane protein [Xylona heveae TC161]KZF20005.1 integral membrane protein [Xylona heveae TC161]